MEPACSGGQNVAPGEPKPGGRNAAPGWRVRLRAAAALVLPLTPPGGLAAKDARRILHLLVPLGLVIGIAYACLYRAAWRCFGEVHGIRLMPAVSVWLLDVALCGGVLLVATARVLDRPGPQPASAGDRSGTAVSPGLVVVTVLIVLCVLKLALWVAIPEGVSTWPGMWGAALNFAYPHAFYRPLLLAPIWGRWGVLLAANLGRPTADADALTRQILSRQSAHMVLGWFAPVTVLTAVYCGYSGRWPYGCVIALGVLALAYLFSVTACRLRGGQDLSTMRATGFVAELAYLLLYMGLSARLYSG
jgi:hypothetical protein